MNFILRLCSSLFFRSLLKQGNTENISRKRQYLLAVLTPEHLESYETRVCGQRKHTPVAQALQHLQTKLLMSKAGLLFYSPQSSLCKSYQVWFYLPDS